ncbi:hypothetical protein GQR58_002870 [Nymphon striatum]|nr:hypothetical protein GQR58_002870 [Nymphon striatum]
MAIDNLNPSDHLIAASLMGRVGKFTFKRLSNPSSSTPTSTITASSSIQIVKTCSQGDKTTDSIKNRAQQNDHSLDVIYPTSTVKNSAIHNFSNKPVATVTPQSDNNLEPGTFGGELLLLFLLFGEVLYFYDHFNDATDWKIINGNDYPENRVSRVKDLELDMFSEDEEWSSSSNFNDNYAPSSTQKSQTISGENPNINRVLNDSSNVTRNAACNFEESDDEDQDVLVQTRKKKSLVIRSDSEDATDSDIECIGDEDINSDQSASNEHNQEENCEFDDDSDFYIPDEEDVEFMDAPTPSPPQFEVVDSDSNLPDVPFNNKKELNTEVTSERILCHKHFLNIIVSAWDVTREQQSNDFIGDDNSQKIVKSTPKTLIENITEHPLYLSISTLSDGNLTNKTLNSWYSSINESLWDLLENVPSEALKSIPQFQYDVYAKLRNLRYVNFIKLA